MNQLRHQFGYAHTRLTQKSSQTCVTGASQRNQTQNQRISFENCDEISDLERTQRLLKRNGRYPGYLSY